MLPSSVKSEKTLKFSENESLTDESARSIASGWALIDAIKLFTYRSSFVLANPTPIDVQPIDSYWHAKRLYNDGLTGTTLSHVSVSEITVEFLGIMHERVKQMPELYFTNKSGANYYTAISPRIMGNDRALILPSADTFYENDMNLVNLCLYSCNFYSNSSGFLSKVLRNM